MGGEVMAWGQGPENRAGPQRGLEPGWPQGDSLAQAPHLWAVYPSQPGVSSPDSKVLRTFLTRKGYGTKNALVVADTWFAGKENESKHAVAVFRIRNVTDAVIDWPVSVFMTAYASLGEPRSIVVNQVEVALDPGDYSASDCAKNAVLGIPPDRDSTVIFMAGSGPDYFVSTTLPLTARSLCLGFFNDCLDLPEGLEFVDDLKVTTEASRREPD